MNTMKPSWLRRLYNQLTGGGISAPIRSRTRKGRVRLQVELLEDRVVPTTSLAFSGSVQGMAVDSSGNQYVNYNGLHGTVALDPTHTVTGADFTGGGNSGHFLVKYAPDQSVVWVKSEALGQVPKIGTMTVGLDAGVEYLYTVAGDYGPPAPLTKMDLNGNVVWSKAASAGVAETSCFVDPTDGSIYVDGTFLHGPGTSNTTVDLDIGTTWADGRDLLTANGTFAFVAKWSADGTLQWSRAVSSSAGNVYAGDNGTIAVANGVVYIGGWYTGNLSLGGLTNDTIGSALNAGDGFVAAYDTNGNYQSIAHFINTGPQCLSAGGSNVYVAVGFGNTTATLNPGPGQTLLIPAHNKNHGGNDNFAVAALSHPSTSTWTLTWVNVYTSLSDMNIPYGLEVSGTGLYVSGMFGDASGGTTNFNPSGTAYNLTGNGDIFAMKLNAATGGLTWVSQIGSAQPGQEWAGLVLTPTGVSLGGAVSQGPVNFVGPNHATPTRILDADLETSAFVAKLNSDGTYGWAFDVGPVGRTIVYTNIGDPINSGYAESGSGWSNGTSSFDSGSRKHQQGNGADTATWTFTGLPNGVYQVVTAFPVDNRNATNAPFYVNGSLVTVNQRIAPNDFSIAGALWKNLATATVTNGTLTVVLTDAANGYVVADAMRIWAVASPRIGSVTQVTAGSSVTLTASNVTDPNPGGVITQVAFYVDSNNSGILDSGDALLGYGTLNPDLTWTYTIDTTGWATGSYTLFAQAQDGFGTLSDPLALTLVVQ